MGRSLRFKNLSVPHATTERVGQTDRSEFRHGRKLPDSRRYNIVNVFVLNRVICVIPTRSVSEGLSFRVSSLRFAPHSLALRACIIAQP